MCREGMDPKFPRTKHRTVDAREHKVGHGGDVACEKRDFENFELIQG